MVFDLLLQINKFILICLFCNNSIMNNIRMPLYIIQESTVFVISTLLQQDYWTNASKNEQSNTNLDNQQHKSQSNPHNLLGYA